MKTEMLENLQTSLSGSHSFHRDYGPAKTTEIERIICRNQDTIYGKRLKWIFFLIHNHLKLKP